VVSILVSGFVGLGGILAGRENKLPDQRLTLRTDGCALVGNETVTERSFNHNSFFGRNDLPDIIAPGDWKEDHAGDSALIKIWSTSYMWQPAIATFVTFFVAMIVSGILVSLRKGNPPKVNASLLGKPFVALWRKLFGEKYLEKWIDFESPPLSGDPQEKAARLNNNNDASQKSHSAI